MAGQIAAIGLMRMLGRSAREIRTSESYEEMTTCSVLSVPVPAAADNFRKFFGQLREECGNRVLSRIYDKDGNPSKWWFQFAKRKFMNINNTGTPRFTN